MKILIVCSFNSGIISPFIKEQVKSLEKFSIKFDYFLLKGKGIIGYLSNLRKMRQKLKSSNYDFIHAHYGLSGLLANMQRSVPVVTTFHGCDLNLKSNRKYSKVAILLSCFSILTNAKQLDYFDFDKKKCAIVPCGVDFDLFKPMRQDQCREYFGLDFQKNYVLFASSFDRPEKNADLAIKAVKKLPNTEIIELSGYSRDEVVKLMNATNIILITSLHETGPLVAKEAWACNKPVISTDIGDISQILGKNRSLQYVVPYDSNEIAERISTILDKTATENFRELVKDYSLPKVASKIKDIYDSIDSS